MANTFLTNVFKTQENVNQDNMNYTVADKDQKITSFFPMPSQNSVSKIFPGVICSGIGTIDNQFGFSGNSTLNPNTFNLTAGVLRFPDSDSNTEPYNNTTPATLVTVAQFVSQDPATYQLTVAPGNYYLISTLVVSSNSQYQFTNTATYGIITIPTINPPNPPFAVNQLALCRIDISATNVITISTDENCAINYGTTQYQPTTQLLQQGRLTGVSGSPYDDTNQFGSNTLYFTPTENGNLISLWNGKSWITQPFNELELPIVINYGTLAPITGQTTIATGTNPQSVAIHPNGNFVYVTNSTAGSISIYTRASSGILAPLTITTGASSNPNVITITPNGSSIYWTNSGQANVFQANINGDGTIIATGGNIATNGQGNGIVISPDNNFVYICGGSGNNFVYQFSRNASGALSALTPNRIATGNGPQGISICPDGNNVYVTNLGDSTISQYSRDLSTGLLGIIGTTAVTTGTSPFGIIISPDGSNVYVTNSFNSILLGNSISQYSRASDGILTALSTPVATGNTPKAIIISPDGSFVYVNNTIANSSGIFTISQYSRGTDGTLTALIPSTVTTASSPTALSISPDNNNVYVTNSTNNTLSLYKLNTLTDVTVIQDGSYDIYVGRTSSGVLSLASDTFNGNRTKLPTPNNNGKWVNNITVGEIPQYQALLLGSISVSSGAIQSWSGNRSIWNLYNQVPLGLLASQIPSTGQWAYGNSTRYHNQNSININGISRFTFLTDPLYNKQLTCSYSGYTSLNGNGDGGNIGIILNTDLPDTGTLPSFVILSSFIGARFSSTSFQFPGSIINNMSYNYQFNNAITKQLPTGLNYIQKVEKSTADSGGFGYFLDTIGLIAEYWG